MRAFIFACVILAGCSSNPLANRISLPLGGNEAYVNSMYGPIGITSKVDPQDAEILRELVRLRATVEAIQRAQAQAQRAQ
ncbi:MAG: hypothetical protein KAY54_10785 [Burkholderiaceae bacterium]|nr:hypothetical protein [Burkholderiaceae bacterium]